jgi:dTDP-4-amino-4,6-dideoxygalactose transaminase
MNINFVDLKKNYEGIKDKISEEFNSLFDNCDFINGKKVTIFENNFAEYLRVKHFIGCANGTDALEIAVKCLDLTPDDEVIVQGNTYIATCLGVLNNNVKLVLCDVVKETHMIDIELLKQKITSKTKAIIVVHLYGLMPNMDKLMDICRDNNLYLIEDCAQAHGALWNGKKAGTFGDLSCFSFYPGKNLGAYGDGGGIGTNNDLYNEKIRKMINIGSKIKYNHEILGRNSRLDTIQASFLNVKLENLDLWNSMRRTNANIYANKLAEVGDLEFPLVENGCTPVYHLYVIRTKYRDALKKFLDEKKIQCLIHYPISVAETDAMKQFQYDLNDVKNCVDNAKEILSLPMYPELEIHEIDYICNAIKSFFIENNLMKLQCFVRTDKTGLLHCINNFNFDTKRFFYVNFNENIIINNEATFKRGFHANVNFNEFIIVIEGGIKIKIMNKKLLEHEFIINKNETFYVPTMNWIEYEALTKNTIIMCLTDKSKSDSESIHDINEFINF